MSASVQSLFTSKAGPMTGAMSRRAAADLGSAPRGFHGRIRALRPLPDPAPGTLPAAELERRLVELGFVEGAEVELLHQGLIGRDPIAVRVDGVTIALRRREAAAVLVEPLD